MIQIVAQPGGPEDLGTFLRDLLLADWTSPDSPLNLNSDISLVDVAAADFFFNTRLFLTVLAEENGAHDCQ
jgi:hypothetical protein